MQLFTASVVATHVDATQCILQHNASVLLVVLDVFSTFVDIISIVIESVALVAVVCCGLRFQQLPSLVN